jgi:hypothetical protein
MWKCQGPVGFTHLRLQGGIGRQSKVIAIADRRKLGLGRDIAAFGRCFGKGQSRRALFGSPGLRNGLIALTGRPCGVGDLFLFPNVVSLGMTISGQGSLKEFKSILG